MRSQADLLSVNIAWQGGCHINTRSRFCVVARLEGSRFAPHVRGFSRSCQLRKLYDSLSALKQLQVRGSLPNLAGSCHEVDSQNQFVDPGLKGYYTEHTNTTLRPMMLQYVSSLSEAKELCPALLVSPTMNWLISLLISRRLAPSV